MNIKSVFKQRLFWKILGVFWVMTLVTIFANSYITRLIASDDFRYEKYQRIFAGWAEEAVRIYENASPHDRDKVLENWYREQFEQFKVRLVLLDEQHRPLIPAPPHMDMHQHRHDSNAGVNAEGSDSHWPNKLSSRPLLPMMASRFKTDFRALLNQAVTGKNGDLYTLRLLPSPYMENVFSELHSYRSYRLLVSIIIIALGSLWLSRSLARPIKKLTEASENMAQGKLETRLEQKLVERKDELGHLGMAFNHMAEKLEAQVKNQKQLFRDISHEIRTPLTRQQIAIELAKTAEDPQVFLEKIAQQGEKINNLIENLLRLIRLEESHTHRDFKKVDLHEILQRVTSSAALEAETRGIELTTDFKEVPSLPGNEGLIERATDNLLGNALKYSPERSTIEIRNYLSDSGIIVEINDQGPGIDPTLLDRVREPFFREDSSRHERTGGHGLGLAIVDEIARLHQAKLILKNRSSGGLQAQLVFPLDQNNNQ